MIKHLQVLKGCKQNTLVWKGRTGKNHLGQQFWLHNLRQPFNECLIGKGARPLLMRPLMHPCATDGELLRPLCRVSSWVQLRKLILE